MPTGRYHLRAVAASLAELVFLNGPWPGLVLALLLLVQPGLAVGAGAAWIGALVAARLIGCPASLTHLVILNVLLTGMTVGHLVAPGMECILAALLVGVLASGLAISLQHLLKSWLDLPMLSLPFVLMAMVVWLAMARYPNLIPANGACWLPWAHPGWPAPVEGFLTALGSLLFLPHALVGLTVALLIAVHSRILLLCAISGYLVGASLRGLAGGSWPLAWAASDGFNAMLAAMAIGGAFLVPSWRSLIIGLLAAAGCAILGDALTAWSAWGGNGLPVFTLPFVVAVLAVLHLLALVRSPLLAQRPGATPEHTLAEHWAALRRFPGTLRTLAPPFTGSWTVWQSTDGRWTHCGPWCHALDFLVCDANGSTHAGDGVRLEDYHAWQQPVLAPVSGQVAVVVDGVPDNPPGQVDLERPWGNLVVIYDARGFWVELSHLACGSLAVQPGQWVERGQMVGRCGNSGHSPQPHLHLQVQVSAQVGAATMPFSLVSWWDGERHQANALPRVGGSVTPLALDPGLEAATRLLLDDRRSFSVHHRERRIGDLHLHTRLSGDGTLCLDAGDGRLQVGRHDGTDYVFRMEGHHRWLHLIRMALPRLPLCRREDLVWEDFLPVVAVHRGWRGQLAAVLALIRPPWAVVRGRYRFDGPWRVIGEIAGNALVPMVHTVVDLDPVRGPVMIQAGDLRLERLPDPPAGVSDHGRV